MLIVELPVLPTVSVVNGPIFKAVLFCRFVSLSGPKRELRQSQRQVLSMFNRSQQRVISKYFGEAQGLGLLRKIHSTQGVDPDVYIRGDFFAEDTQESRALITMSHSLWGSKGLLKTFPYPTAWGHGCLSPGVILCLATLSVLDESISKKSLRRYLAPLVPESSFNSAMRFIKEHHLAFGEVGRLIIAPDWEAKIRSLLDKNPKCNERHLKGNERRRTESEANRVKVSRGRLSSTEHSELIKLPCVIKGCKNKRHVEEHFPPWHFLQHIEGRLNRQFVWSICPRHNGKMSAFIKTLDGHAHIWPNYLELAPGNDPMRIYSSAANRWISKFYKAYEARDIPAATQAVKAVLGLWKALALLPDNYDVVARKPGPNVRRTVGKNPYSPERSQLPYRPI